MSKTGRKADRHGHPSEPPPLYHGGSHTAIQLPPGRKVGRKEGRKKRLNNHGGRGGGGDDDDDYMTTACMHLSIYLPPHS